MPRAKPANAARVVERETITREEIPAEELNEEVEKPHWRDYVANLTPDEWNQHIVYLYRHEGSNPRLFLEKFAEHFDEAWIKERHGGGTFSFILKGPGGEWLYQDKIYIEGRAKAHEETETEPNGGGTNTEQMHRELLQLLREQIKSPLRDQAARDGLEIHKAAVLDALEMRKTIQGGEAGAPMGPPTWVVELLKPLGTALLAKILEPQNPIKQFNEFMEAAKNLPGFGMGAGGNEPNTGAMLVQSAPQLLDRIASIARDYRLASEANAQGRRLITVQPGAAGAAPAGASPETAAGGTPNHEANAAAIPAPTFAWVAAKVVELVNDPNGSGEEIGTFLNVVSPQLVDQLAQMDSERVIGFFRTQPILNTVAEHPRLPQLVGDFLAWARETQNEAAPEKDTAKS